jgi:flagellar FliL protein
MKAEATGAPDGGAQKKKLMVIIIVALVAVGAGAGVMWFVARGGGSHGAAAAEHKPAKLEPPVFVAIDPFTVNLQQETGEQYLQTAFTLQVDGQEQAVVIKENMPQVRSRLLLLLSSKKASELASTEGKKSLSEEIVAQVSQPFGTGAPPQKVTGVFFTSFIVQ